MAATPITGFPASAIPPPDDYVFVLADPAGVHLSANYKIRYGDLKLAFGGAGSVGAMGPVGMSGEDGDDAMMLPGTPGPAGAAGSNGIIGRDGNPGLAGEDGEDGMIGPPGLRGADGAAGAAGLPGIGGVIGLDGLDGEDAPMIPGPQGIQGPAGGGGGGSATTVEINLGATPVTRGKFTITDAAISATSKVLCWQAPGPYTGKGTRADEAEMAPVRVLAVEPTAGSAVVKWEAKSHVSIAPQAFNPNSGDGGNKQGAIAVVSNVIDNFKTNLQALVIGKVEGNVKFSYTVLA